MDKPITYTGERGPGPGMAKTRPRRGRAPRHVIVQRTTGAGRLMTPKRQCRFAPVDVYTRRIRWVNRLLATTVVLATLLSAHHVRSWYREVTRQQQTRALLHGVRKREIDFRRKNGAFAGSIEDLRVAMPPEMTGTVRVFAGRFSGDPDFLVEYCDTFSCTALDAECRTRLATRYVPEGPPRDLPDLVEGPGRFFVTSPQNRSKMP